jgi:phosphatidylglycerol---prolipoprotein diacylglyceryl transferase
LRPASLYYAENGTMIHFTPVNVLFTIKGVTFYACGTAYSLSFFIALLLAYLKLKGSIGGTRLVHIAVLGLIGFILGARLLYVVTQPGYFIHHPGKILALSEGGSSSYGGCLAVLLIWLYTRIQRMNFLQVLDAIAPYVALGLALGRIGCFMSWCCYGIPSNVPWAVNADGIPRHPTQLYLVMANFVVFLILRKMQERREKLIEEGKQHLLARDGSIFLFFLLGYGGNRFFIDFLRVYKSPDMLAGLPISQWGSLAFVVFSVTFLVILRRRTARAKVT